MSAIVEAPASDARSNSWASTPSMHGAAFGSPTSLAQPSSVKPPATAAAPSAVRSLLAGATPATLPRRLSMPAMPTPATLPRGALATGGPTPATAPRGVSAGPTPATALRASSAAAPSPALAGADGPAPSPTFDLAMFQAAMATGRQPSPLLAGAATPSAVYRLPLGGSTPLRRALNALPFEAALHAPLVDGSPYNLSECDFADEVSRLFQGQGGGGGATPAGRSRGGSGSSGAAGASPLAMASLGTAAAGAGDAAAAAGGGAAGGRPALSPGAAEMLEMQVSVMSRKLLAATSALEAAEREREVRLSFFLRRRPAHHLLPPCLSLLFLRRRRTRAAPLSAAPCSPAPSNLPINSKIKFQLKTKTGVQGEGARPAGAVRRLQRAGRNGAGGAAHGRRGA
jgi:uncharacterized membrane protein YgcG